MFASGDRKRRRHCDQQLLYLAVADSDRINTFLVSLHIACSIDVDKEHEATADIWIADETV